MQINSLNLDDDSTSVEVSKEEDVVISTVDLPSAKTLRGGTNIVAKGRHGIKSENSLVSRSAVSSYSTSSSRCVFLTLTWKKHYHDILYIYYQYLTDYLKDLHCHPLLVLVIPIQAVGM